MSRANGDLDADDVVGDVTAADLAHRRQAPSTTPSDERPRCPECNALGPRTRGTGHNSVHDRGHRCGNCGHTWTDAGADE